MRKMNKKGLFSILAAGAVGLSGAVCALREKPLEDGWKRCELHVESPSPDLVQKVLDKTFERIYGPIPKHPENVRVYCTNWHFPNEEEVHHRSCYTQLAHPEGWYVELVEELISPDKYKFSSLNVTGAKKGSNSLNELSNNVPWIFKAGVNEGYTFENFRGDRGEIVKRRYEMESGKRFVVEDTNGDGILDRYKEEKSSN